MSNGTETEGARRVDRPGFDLVYRLGEDNADRPCRECDEPATHYYFSDGAVSTYRCEDHPPAGR